MAALDPADMLLLRAYRFNRHRRALLHLGTGARISIGSRALGVLGVLVEHAGDLVPKDKIMEAVWPETVVEEANLTVHISRLRRILDTGGSEGSCIQTISGRGYRFVGEVRPHDSEGRSRLETLGARTVPRLSIVVLPIKNLGSDPQQEYFADAITDTLTTDLSRIAGSFVISSNTALTYRGKPVGARQIGSELGVRYVLEGSLYRLGDQVRINAQLIDAESEAHLWAERFDRQASDLFALQDEITGRIATALNAVLIDAEAARPSQQPEALDYIFRGRAARLKPKSRGTYVEGIGLFERALELDRHSVEAQSYLARALAGRVLDNMTDTAAADLRRAEELVQRALAASRRSPVPYIAKGNVLRAQSRFEEAIPEYETALMFDRNLVVAYSHIGQCLVFTGRVEEAVPLYDQAIRLSPRDPDIGILFMRIGIVHMLQSRPVDGINWFEKARNSDPGLPNVRSWLAAAYALNDEPERAANELAEARGLSGDARFRSITHLKAVSALALPKIRAAAEATFFAGLRKAGMPEY
jgi:TolB-like protein/Flp pilus assembly protein TadD